MPLTFVDGDSPMRTALGGPLFFQSVSPIDWLSHGSFRPDVGLQSIPRESKLGDRVKSFWEFVTKMTLLLFEPESFDPFQAKSSPLTNTIVDRQGIRETIEEGSGNE